MIADSKELKKSKQKLKQTKSSSSSSSKAERRAKRAQSIDWTNAAAVDNHSPAVAPPAPGAANNMTEPSMANHEEYYRDGRA